MKLHRYQCHKVVQAAKILEVRPHELLLDAPDHVLEVGYDYAFKNKHNPQQGMYYVVYADGYRSVSPAEAFEEGYTLLPEVTP